MTFNRFTMIVAGAFLALPAFAQDREGWPSSLSFSTGSQGGVYFIWGSGIATMIGEKLDIPSSVEITGGSVQNISLMESEETLLAFTTAGAAQEAMNGENELMPGYEFTSMRALFPMYQTPFQGVVMAGSGVSSYEELEGKRVNFGPASGTSGTYWPRYFDKMGISVKASFSGASDGAGQLADGLVDAFVYAAGIPNGAFSQLAIENDVEFLPLSEENITAFIEAVPSLQRFDMPAGTYNGQDEAISTVAMWNFGIAHKDIPDDLAYEITKMVMEGNARMVQIHSSAAAATLENWDKNTVLPYHRGAIRYYEEQGITIPDSMRADP